MTSFGPQLNSGENSPLTRMKAMRQGLVLRFAHASLHALKFAQIPLNPGERCADLKVYVRGLINPTTDPY
jgi:hypothetical protein